MDLRGAAQSLVCPRCETEMPPDGAILATCPRCKLSFTPKPRDEVVMHRPRERARDDDPDEPPPLFAEDHIDELGECGVSVGVTPDALVLRFGEWRGWGFAGLFGSVAFTVAAASTASILEHLAYPALAGLSMVSGATYTPGRMLRVDAQGLTRRVRPWPPRLLTHDTIAGLGIHARTDWRGPYWTISTVSKLRDVTQVFATNRGIRTAELVMQSIVDALTVFSAGPRSSPDPRR